MSIIFLLIVLISKYIFQYQYINTRKILTLQSKNVYKTECSKLSTLSTGFIIYLIYFILKICIKNKKLMLKIGVENSATKRADNVTSPISICILIQQIRKFDFLYLSLRE